MLRSRHIGFVVFSALITCLAGGAMAQPAAAELVDHSHDRQVITIPDDEVCGVPVTTTVDYVAINQERLAKSGFPLFKSTGRGTITFTNPENGKSVVLRYAGSTRDLTVVDNGDGTITLRWAVTGLAEAISSSDGTVATRDVGRVVFVTVLDYGGTPTDTSDDEFVSEEVESVSGPHPELESNFDLFCQLVGPALT